MASPTFTVNGSAVSGAVSVAYGSTVTLALVSITGVQSVAWSYLGRSHTSTAYPTITPAGVPNGASATFTMPADPTGGEGRSFLLQCTVNGILTASAIIGAANVRGTVPLAAGETTQRAAEGGWIAPINTIFASPGTPGYSGLTSATSFNASTQTSQLPLTVNKDASLSAFAANDVAVVRSAATPGDFIVGTVQSYSGTTLTVAVPVINAGANTTHTDWRIALIGLPPLVTVVDAGAASQTISAIQNHTRVRMRGASGAGNCAVTLPAVNYTADQAMLVATDVVGHGASATFTLTAGSGTTIRGSSSLTFTTAYQSIGLTYNAATTNWE